MTVHIEENQGLLLGCGSGFETPSKENVLKAMTEVADYFAGLDYRVHLERLYMEYPYDDEADFQINFDFYRDDEDAKRTRQLLKDIDASEDEDSYSSITAGSDEVRFLKVQNTLPVLRGNV